MPQKLSRRRKDNSAPKPKGPKPPSTACRTSQYFIIDTLLPSHVVNDRSLFTTYMPSNRVYRTAFGTNITIRGTGNVEVRVVAGGKSIIFTIHDCWHVPSSPHHFLSSLSVTSPSRGNQVMLAGRTPRLLFQQKQRLAKPDLPKYVPFAREGGYFVLKFDVPTQVSLPPQCNPTTVRLATQTVLSLQASAAVPGSVFPQPTLTTSQTPAPFLHTSTYQPFFPFPLSPHPPLSPTRTSLSDLTYSAFVSFTPSALFEKPEEAHLFRYSKDELISICQECEPECQENAGDGASDCRTIGG